MLTFRFLSANPLKHPLLKREKANLPYFFRRSLKKGFTRVILRVSCSLTRFIQPPSGEKYFHFTTLIILKLQQSRSLVITSLKPTLRTSLAVNRFSKRLTSLRPVLSSNTILVPPVLPTSTQCYHQKSPLRGLKN